MSRPEWHELWDDLKLDAGQTEMQRNELTLLPDPHHALCSTTDLSSVGIDSISSFVGNFGR
jgi:hypothetical protein